MKKNIRNYIIFLLVLILCLGCLTACGTREEPVRVESFSASFVRGYFSIPELLEDSDKIAVVKVLDEGTAEDVEGGVCTVNQVEVVTPVYGCEEGEAISHLTPGGLMEGVLTIANEVEQLEKGKTYLLFMGKEGSGRYIDLNYDQGRFYVEDGMVTSAHYDPETKEKSADQIACIKDVPLEDVLTMTQEAIAALPEE